MKMENLSSHQPCYITVVAHTHTQHTYLHTNLHTCFFFRCDRHEPFEICRYSTNEMDKNSFSPEENFGAKKSHFLRSLFFMFVFQCKAFTHNLQKLPFVRSS